VRERWTAMVMATCILVAVGCSSNGHIEATGSVTEAPAPSVATLDAVDLTGMIRDATGLVVDPPEGIEQSVFDSLRPKGVTSAARAVGDGPVVITTSVFESPERAHAYFSDLWGPGGAMRNRPNSSVYMTAAVCGPILVTITAIGSAEQPKRALPPARDALTPYGACTDQYGI